MSDLEDRLVLRAKILGVLLKDARLARGQTVEACAAAMGCDPQTLADYERGAASPSLPELELLAYFLDVPLAHFWGDRVLSERSSNGRAPLPAGELASLRNRIIGARLRQARQNARLEAGEVAAPAGLTADELSAYEDGQAPIPVPELELLASRLGLGLEGLFESQGPVGEWDSRQRALERVRQLPPDLCAFLSQPINERYLRLAQQLSELPAEKLRAIAASLLEITY